MSRPWTAESLLETVRGFQPACVVAAAADLDLFAALGEESVTAAAAAERVDGDLRGTTILLDALAAIGLLAKEGDHYSVPPPLRPLLSPGRPGSVLGMVQHQANCLRRWAELGRTIREGRPAGRAESIRGAAADRAAFIEAMNDIARETADRLVGDLMPIPFRHLLDVGGASGTYTIAWLRAAPEARATLFDLAEVIPLAEERLGAEGLSDRVRLVAGDFYEDPLPGGADLAWISAIIHQNSREQNRALFAKVLDALDPGGRILIRDIVMEESRTRPVAGAFFAVNMLSATEAGGTWTLAEIAGDLEAAGFARVEQIREDEWMHSVVAAVKPVIL